jgi:tetratricopeptide (TPR) repeat protein
MIYKDSAQELAEQAKLNFESGDFAAAGDAFADAAKAFEVSGDQLMAAEMKNNRSVALLKDKKTQAALETILGTEEVFQQAGDDRRLGMALANQGAAFQALKRFDEAIQSYRLAITALERAGEDALKYKVVQLQSALYLSRFKILDAVISLQSGLVTLKNPTPMQRFMKKMLFFRL